jgi:hypothetical protein
MSGYLKVMAAVAGLVIALGAAVTSGHPEWTGIHRIAGIVLVVGMLGLVRAGAAGWIALGLAGLECIPMPPILHAWIAPLIPLAILFQPLRRLRTERGAIEWLAILSPVLVLVQVAFGAAYRHKVWGVMPHMAGAMLVALLVLICCMQILQRKPEWKTPAVWAMSVVLTQVALGIASFLLRLLDMETTPWFTVATVLHVTNGTATLLATASLAWFVVADPAAR